MVPLLLKAKLAGVNGSWRDTLLPLGAMARRAFFSLVGFLSFMPGCHKKIEPQECVVMLDRYIDMVVSADLGARNVPPSQVAAVRETKKAAKKAEANYVHVQSRCEAEVTRNEYDCAMASKNADEWEACIE
jgi:hypothetical protein